MREKSLKVVCVRRKERSSLEYMNKEMNRTERGLRDAALQNRAPRKKNKHPCLPQKKNPKRT
jgi:hypothetical protein